MIDVSANATGHAWMHMCVENLAIGLEMATQGPSLTGIDQIGIGKWQLQVWF